MSDLFLYDLNEKGIATITLNRAEIHNAFNDEMILGLTTKFEEMNKNDSVRVVVLTGEGKSFCAGADLNWMKSMVDYSEQENFEDSKRLSNLFESINNFSKPVVGKINGAALGGGVGLVACCDFVIASENAKFGLTEVLLGLVPAVISPYVIAKMGESNARATFLTGDRFDGAKAIEYGLVHQVSLDRHFHKDVDAFCEKLLKAAPKAQQVAKSLIKNVISLTHSDYDTTSSYTCKTIAAKRVCPEGQEGMSALLEKRKPSWIK